MRNNRFRLKSVFFQVPLKIDIVVNADRSRTSIIIARISQVLSSYQKINVGESNVILVRLLIRQTLVLPMSGAVPHVGTADGSCSVDFLLFEIIISNC